MPAYLRNFNFTLDQVTKRERKERFHPESSSSAANCSRESIPRDVFTSLSLSFFFFLFFFFLLLQQLLLYSNLRAPLHSGYEDSLKSLQRRERGNEISRGIHDTSTTTTTSMVVGRRGAQTTRRRQRYNSFSNGESMYSHEMTLQREQRCCNVGTEKRRKKEGGGVAREHRRAHSEAENNITETVIHEHPGTEISLSSSLQNTSPLHGEFDGLQ